MKTRTPARFGSSPASARWVRPASARADREGKRSAALALIAVAVLLLATIAGFSWAQDRQLRGGLLAQQTEAMQRPDWVELRSLPPYVALSLLVAVDPTFLQRSPLAVGAEGATLSGELASQVHRLGDGVRGEARRMVMGRLLEARLSDAEMLELFVNRVHLGRDRGWPVYGVHHAAREYFGKSPQELTLGEAATLAGLLLPPRIDEPRQRVGAVGIRRNEVLLQMADAGAIEPDAYQAALQEPLGFQPGPEYSPMSRPAGWDREPDVIRLPPELTAPLDTLPAP